MFNGFVSGDSSQWFELPGGPVGMALGAEYRRETFKDAQDELLEAGLTHYTPSPPFDPPAFEVKEVFGELRAPILANRPGAHELTLALPAASPITRAALARFSRGMLGGEWAPVRDAKLRINKSRAVRAPNLVEKSIRRLGRALPTASFSDPCSAESIGAGSPTREANCLADSVPEGFEIFT